MYMYMYMHTLLSLIPAIYKHTTLTLILCGAILCVLTLTQHPLWNQLIKDYQEQGVLVEGPLNNLRKNEMHIPKPIKLFNKRNPVR